MIANAERLTALVEEFRVRVPSLVDPVEIAASLESSGINDSVARDRFNARDTFDLAAVLTSRIRSTGPLVARVAPADAPDDSTERRQAAVDYLRGPLALIPIVLLLVIVAAYGEVGRWSTATTLAFSVGMTSSMLVTNCFVQALSRRGAIYVSREDYASAGAFISLVLRVALCAVVVVTVVGVLATVALGVFTPTDGLIFGAAFAALSLVWLLAGVLALVRAPALLVLALGAGIVVAVAVDRVAATIYRDHVLVASILGYATAIGTMLVAARRRYGRADSGEPAPSLPSLAYLLDEATPYFTYGARYMALVLLPHVIAWLAVMKTEADRVTAATSFEIALTASLLPIVVTGGLAERSARLFWHSARAALRQTSMDRPQQFGEALRRFYATQMVRYLIAMIAASLMAYAAFSTPFASETIRALVPATNAALVQVLFAAGLVGYLLLGCGLFNCIFIVGLGRPQHANNALTQGIIGTLIVGSPLVLGFHFGYSVVAFAGGALVFALSSFSAAHHLLASADYHYYASS